MKLIVTYELDTREGVAELLAATKHLELCPLVSSAVMSDEEFAETCPPEPPTGEVTEDTTYENRAELTRTLGWNDIALTFAQNFEKEGYEVEVQDNDGVIVKTHTHLHEWSGYVTEYINAQDAEGLINYLVGLNTTSEGMRDGTIIR